MFPLILLALLGFLLQKGTKSIDIAVLGKLSLYLLTPATIFLGAYKTPLEWQYLMVPFLVFTITAFSTLLLVFFLRKLFPQSPYTEPAFVSATGNVGYFGLPLVLAFFGESSLSLAVLGMMGFTLSESTIGAFIMARGHHGAQKAFMTVVKLPSVWLFLVGIGIHILGLNLPSSVLFTIEQLKTTYITIGMILIGISFAGFQMDTIDWKQVMKMITVKHFWQPLWFFVLVPVFALFFTFDPLFQKILIIQSLCPIAGNIIIYASVFHQKINDIVVALLISTILAFIIIPAFMVLF
ncbi:MAG: hypothetical protein WCJ84_00085 [Candidatus Peregrinibacteria bacterium]